MSALGNAQAQAGRYLQTERGLRCFAKTIGDIMIWATLADQRRTLRRQLGHLAVIVAERGAPQHYCLVIDTSDGGMRVSTSHDFEVPDQFFLRLSGEEATYKVVWRKGRQVGAKLASRASPRA
jgi:hypothetical protein